MHGITSDALDIIGCAPVTAGVSQGQASKHWTKNGTTGDHRKIEQGTPALIAIGFSLEWTIH